MVAECVLKTSALTLIVWGVSLLLRRQSAAFRHALWMSALGGFFVIPALMFFGHKAPRLRVPVTFRPTLTWQVTVTQARAGTRWQPQVPIVGIIWMAGSLLLCVRRGRAAWRMARIASKATVCEGNIRLSSDIRGPVTWGILDPVILLPSAAMEWTPDLMAKVLAHEREHVRRFDLVWHWGAEMVSIAWWFHPCAWFARRMAAHERECACDDAVIRGGIRPSDYAGTLLQLISTIPQRGDQSMALSALSNFERRIHKILQPDRDRRPAGLVACTTIAIATCMLIAPLALVHAQGGQGNLSGVVTDPSGARVPNATIIVSGSEGNREITHANRAGVWSLNGIPAGNYSVEIRAPGFKVGSKDVTVVSGQSAMLNLPLRLGSAQEEIHVVATGQPRIVASDENSSGEPIRIGGMVQPAMLLKQVKPMYPESAKAQGIEGTVLLNAVIGKDGSLLSVAVANKSVDPDLAAAALDAVKQWRFRPTLLNGEPVEIITTITVDFKLQM